VGIRELDPIGSVSAIVKNV